MNNTRLALQAFTISTCGVGVLTTGICITLGNIYQVTTFQDFNRKIRGKSLDEEIDMSELFEQLSATEQEQTATNK